MPSHEETNPHFKPEHRHPHFRPTRTPVGAATPADAPPHQAQANQPPLDRPWMSSPPHPQHQDHQSQTGPLLAPAPRQPLRSPRFVDPPRPEQPSRGSKERQAKKPKRHDPHHQPMGPWIKLPEHKKNQDQPTAPPQGPAIGPRGHQPETEGHSNVPQERAPVTRPPPAPHHHPFHHHHQPKLWLPPPRRTKLLTWFLAGFCTIFWIVIILGGLIVLIIYLIFRPHNPRFDVSSVTLNSAYLDMGLLLNADLTILANFTNPNRKVRVDFSTVVLDLYYGKSLIASQYVEPFSAERAQTRFASVHMVTSQVRLPLAEGQRLKREIGRNAVMFQIKGVFRARSNLGSFLKYSYWLYGNCNVMMSGPPDGVSKGIRCRTKR